MLNALHPVMVIASREVRDQFRDWRIIFPILGLTVLFPFLMNFTASQMLGFVNKYGAAIIGERLVPFLLMIVGFFPISVSLVIALESFVGEKERGSIEPLLNTPLKDWQLYLGKLLSSTVPPLVSSYLGMLVYIVGLDDFRYPDTRTTTAYPGYMHDNHSGLYDGGRSCCGFLSGDIRSFGQPAFQFYRPSGCIPDPG